MKIDSLKSDKKYLIIMSGISGSGKSTLANKIKVNLNCNLIETDDIRRELTNDPSDQTMNRLVFEIAEKRMIEFLSIGTSVIFDATNLSSKDRKKYIQIGKSSKDTEVVSVYIVPNLSIANVRNRSRDRVVPSEVILKQYSKFQTPTVDEGFDVVICEKND